MGKIRRHPPVKLIAGFIFAKEEQYLRAKKIMARFFSAPDFETEVLSFEHTGYYAGEFGTGLKRVFLSFRRLIPAERLAEIKIITNRIESRLSVNGRRTVNIDPGYIDLAKLVLATTKDYSHRIYLGSGISAEVTLFYSKGDFQSWPWTYPDYCTPEYRRAFCRIREIYSAQIKK